MMFLHKDKLKLDITLQVDSWLYNELMALKKNVRELQGNLDNEKMKRMELEVRVGNIPGRLRAYEVELRQLVKDSGQ